MISQIDEKLEKLITLENITDNDLIEYFGKLPDTKEELLAMQKNLMAHIRTYGRHSPGLEKYMEKLK